MCTESSSNNHVSLALVGKFIFNFFFLPPSSFLIIHSQQITPVDCSVDHWRSDIFHASACAPTRRALRRSYLVTRTRFPFPYRKYFTPRNVVSVFWNSSNVHNIKRISLLFLKRIGRVSHIVHLEKSDVLSSLCMCLFYLSPEKYGKKLKYLRIRTHTYTHIGHIF